MNYEEISKTANRMHFWERELNNAKHNMKQAEESAELAKSKLHDHKKKLYHLLQEVDFNG